MEKFKICPICKEKNPPSFLECENCGTDLLGIPITSDEQLIQSVEKHEENNSTPHSQQEYVRICDCGFINPVSARKCSKCGEDISDITPKLFTDEKEKKWILTSIDGDFSFELKEGQHTIGREAELSEFLASKSYVSRNHCKIMLQNGELTVENLSRTNHTFINNIMIDNITKISNGDEIGLGGRMINGSRQSLAAYFIVEIK